MKTLIEKLKRLKTPYLLLMIFALAALLRIIYYAEVHKQILFQTLLFDAQYYDDWAKNILKYGWVGKGIFFVSPLYAYFLAVIYKFGGNPNAVRFLQFILGSTVPLFIYAIGARLFDKRIAVIASLLSCFYGPAIFFDGLLLKTSLEVFFTCLTIFLLTRNKDSEQKNPWIISGVAAGITVLAKETMLLFIPLVLVWITLNRGSLKKALKPFLYFCLGVSLVIGPLTLRNIIVGKDFVLTTYSSGMNFHVGNFKGSDGSLKEPDFIRMIPFFEEVDSQHEAERRVGRKLKSSEVSSFWFRETLKQIKEDPNHFGNLLFKKTGLLFNRTGISDNYQMVFFKRYSFAFNRLFLGFWPIVVLGLSGMIFLFWFSKRLKEQSLLLLFFFSTSLLLILGHIIDRYREVLVPALILLGAYFINEIYLNCQKKKYFVLSSGAALIIIFALLTSIHYPNFDQMPYADAYNQIGLLYHHKGDYPNAIRQYQNALKERPNHLWARQNLADIYLRTDRVEEALKEYKKAISDRPDVLELYVMLQRSMEMREFSREEILKELDSGELPKKLKLVSESNQNPYSYYLGMEYMNKKEFAKAIEQFQKVIEAAPNSINAMINLGVASRANGQPDKAIAAYERALKIVPEIIPARYNLAMVLLAGERFKEALPHLEKITGILPEYLLAQYYLAQVYEKTDQIQKAIEEYKKVAGRAGMDPKSSRLAEQARDKIWFLEDQLNKPKINKTPGIILDKGRYE